MEPNPSSSPAAIGRFRIDAKLGAGGMGEVYKGFDPSLQRTVAVKTVRPDMGSPEYVERLYREAQACARLQHPHIVTIFEVGEFDQGVFIAMEFLKGENLATALKAGRLSLRAKLGVLIQVLDALAHAHDEGVIHRDIKPSNVHLLPDLSIKLLDFGLARMESAGTITISGSVMGTPHYASPEQLRAERVDARSDVFSTGALAYELFEGHRPFEADTISAVLIKVLSEPPAPPAGAWSRQVPGLLAIVERAIAKAPADRYQTAREMKQEVEALIDTEGDAIAAVDADGPVAQDDEAGSTHIGGDAPTRLTREAATQRTSPVAQAAPTVPTMPVAARTASQAPLPAVSEPAPARATGALAVAAGVLLAVAIGGMVLYQRAHAPQASGDAREPGAPPATTAAPDGGSPGASVAAPSAPAPAAEAAAVRPSDAAGRAVANGTSVAATAPSVSPAASADTAPPAAGGVAGSPVQARTLFTSAAGAVRNAGLKWRVIRKLDTGEDVDVDPDQTFHSGDRVRLAFESNIDGFLYVALQGSSHKWTLLFPGEAINGGSNAVGRGQLYQVPDNGWFRFDDTPGQEELFVVLSRERLADLPGFQGRVRANESLPSGAVDDLKMKIASRDLVFEKDPPPPKGAPVKAVLAQYVVNRDELGKAVSATITLKHGR